MIAKNVIPGLLAVLTGLTFPARGAEFNRVFAPQGGLVSRYEEPLRQEICLNGSWQFQGDPDTSVPAGSAPALGPWEQTAIKIPSPWNVNGLFLNQMGGDFRAYPSYPAAWEKLPAAWMQKTVNVPAAWTGHRVLLHFGAVAGDLVVYVNGQRAGEGFDIFFAQDFDVSPFLHFGADNQILVKVVSPKVFDRPGHYGRREYLSGSFWGTFIAGIWQDVFLEAEPPAAVSDVFVQPQVDRDTLTVEVTVANHGPTPATLQVSGSVREWLNQAGHSVLEAPEVKWTLAGQPSLELPGQPLTLAPGETKTVVLTTKVDGRLKLWSPDAPNLYGLLVTLSSDGKATDTKYERFGWRQFNVQGNQLLLNGRPIVLHGDSWHFLGIPQMTRRYPYAWYSLLKDAGANAVRLHASVYPSFYHDLADEMGIMILDESAIWASDGGPKADSDLFWTNCRNHVAALVRRDRNHPSVFGWSVCNEILPVLRNVWHTPQGMVDHCLDEIAGWRDICLTNDPTRGWISGDGEWDAEKRLPTINNHYGGENDMQRAAASGKPWAVGETSMAYYGTPKQVAKFNGNRAYESDLGRMEGLAYECYGLLSLQQRFSANYQSVFNLVWYSVQPLPLGKPDLARPVDLSDGIFFGPYQEGQPGVQPERLGPYTTTLNPGYDSTLPLYRPWPMFAAIRDANLGNTNSPWAHGPDLTAPKNPAATPAPGKAIASYLPENGQLLVQELARAGLEPGLYSAATNTDFLLLDGSIAPDASTAGTLKSAMDKVLGHGGTVWIWNLKPASAPAFSRWLGEPIQAEPRVASSFVVKSDDPLLAGLDNAGLYFAEDDDWQQMACGLSGAWVDHAHVLLEATTADWRRWNYKGEPVKTASLFRSEVENPAPRAVIVVRDLNPGRVILCNLLPAVQSSKKLAIMQRLFRNEGIEPTKVVAQGGFTDLNGRLVRALVCGSFAVADLHQSYAEKLPDANIRDNALLNGQRWKLSNSSPSGVFDFKKGLVHGPQENACAYLAVWIKSPKPLNDLLSEPNLPKLSFVYGADDGCQVWLNGELLATHERHGPLEPEAFALNPLLLKLGWNQFVIKVVQAGGEWQFAGRFDCSDASFISKLEFGAEKPAGL